MLYFRDLAPELPDHLSQDCREALETFLLPVAGHYRPDHFNQEVLEDYRRRIARKGVSYQAFRQFHLPCFHLLLERAVQRGGLEEIPILFSYPDAVFPFGTQARKWLASLQTTYRDSTVQRYQSIVERDLLLAFGEEDLALLDGVRLARYREEHLGPRMGERTFIQHSGVLYGTLDFSIAELIGRVERYSPVLFQEIALRWLEDFRKNVSPRTAEEAQSSLEKHLLPLLGNKRLDHFNTRRIQEYKRAVAARGISDSTFRKHWTIILGVLQYAVEHGAIRELPSFDIRYPARETRIQRPDESLLQQALIQDTSIPDSMIVRLAWQMGLSREEIRDLTWDDLNLEQRSATVAGRIVPIPEEVVEILTGLKEETGPDGPVLRSVRGNPLTSANLSYITKKYLSKHGIENSRLMDLRHDYVIRTLQSHSLEETARLCGYKEVRDLIRLYRPYLGSPSGES